MTDPIVEKIIEKMYGTDREDRVYVPVAAEWCLRHDALYDRRTGTCGGRWIRNHVPVPLYIEAQDP
jgi:hypothetical protein